MKLWRTNPSYEHYTAILTGHYEHCIINCMARHFFFFYLLYGIFSPSLLFIIVLRKKISDFFHILIILSKTELYTYPSPDHTHIQCKVIRPSRRNIVLKARIYFSFIYFPSSNVTLVSDEYKRLDAHNFNLHNQLKCNIKVWKRIFLYHLYILVLCWIWV